MRFRSLAICLFAGALLALVAGCERGDPQSISSETDEPAYRSGQQLVKQGRNQEALAAYLKVIAKRGESAPESHLEAGLLYLDQVKDPLAAIYHFRKYLELQPNSPQAKHVRARIDVAKREFARTLPAQPLENQAERFQLMDQLDRLQRENDQMRAELATFRGGAPMPTVRTRGPLEPEPAGNTAREETRPRPFLQPANELASADGATDESPVLPAPVTVDDQGSGLLPPTPTGPVRSAPTKPTAPATAGRRHVVAKGDTLFSLAQKYYGNRSRWRDIYAANRDVLPSENALRLGMELKIP